MKRAIVIIILFFSGTVVFSQPSATDKYRDSLVTALSQAPDDTVKMVTLTNLGGYYVELDRDSALFLFEKAMSYAKKMDQQIWVALLSMNKGYVLMHQGNLPAAFKLVNESRLILDDKKNEKNAYTDKASEFSSDIHKYRLDLLAGAYHHLGNLYSNAGDKEKAIAYYKAEIQLCNLLKSRSGMVTSNMNIGSIYLDMNKLDSAYFYSSNALAHSVSTGWLDYQGSILEDLGEIYFKRNQLDSARQYYWRSVRVSKEQNNVSDQVSIYITVAKFYRGLQQADSMMFYAREALRTANYLKIANGITASANLVSGAYQLQGRTDSAYAYLLMSKKISDSLNTDRNQKLAQFQNISFDEQMRVEKTERENATFRSKVRTIALFIGLGLLGILALVFYRNNRRKQRTNKILEDTLADLKNTQSQLIQSEKMASLGELTAGIAHEIQNPLNFVNNFSEVSNELLGEMNEEIKKGNYTEVKAITEDVRLNLEKINHHGKRADAIVKGMLQHSRSSSGKKEPTDINALCEEYLRLSYHGLRAKDKLFNATIKTDFDDSIGMINVIPQDVGRVVLNLLTNAFYVVDKKKKTGIGNYEPTVSISTKKMIGKVEIRVSDNGDGIPDAVKEKIFQPFFTTKPTGQGTGLGLSLSYDIITKGHSGELKVETKEGEGSTFIIQLPTT